MSPVKKILIADDEADIVEIIRFNLEAQGFQIESASNGVEAVEKAKKQLPDLIILDIMMPLMNGMDACVEIRNHEELRQAMVIFLTAKNDELTEVQALELGADDFISKPIRPKVLATKINSLLRRSSSDDSSQILESAELRINRERFTVLVRGNEIMLAKKEFELLALLASKPGKVFLRNEILSQIWGTEVIVGDRTIDVHIRKIRQKLDLDCITTVKGVGYKFNPGI
ncbi:MAG: response regulator transcription factor [Ferruginibacter sp.]